MRSVWLFHPCPDIYLQAVVTREIIARMSLIQTTLENCSLTLLVCVIHWKKFVSNSGLTNVRVLDTCCVTSCVGTANTESRLNALRDVMAADGVHYLSEGYVNLVAGCVSAVDASINKTEVIRTNTCQTKHFWRGFRSLNGAKIVVRGNSSRGSFARGSKRGKPGRYFHPYRRNWYIWNSISVLLSVIPFLFVTTISYLIAVCWCTTHMNRSATKLFATMHKMLLAAQFSEQTN